MVQNRVEDVGNVDHFGTFFHEGTNDVFVRFLGGVGLGGFDFGGFGGGFVVDGVERVGEEVGPVDTLFLFDGEHFAEEFFGVGGDFVDFFGDGEGLGVDTMDESGKVLVFVGADAEEHFVEDDSEGPDVGFYVVWVAFEDFGGHVNGGANHSEGELIGA